MCVFEGILAYLVSGPKSTPDFPGLPRISLDLPGLLLVFVEIMPDEVILDHKISYLFYFENFHFLRFFNLRPIFAKIEKNENFQNRPNMTFYDLK